MSDIRPVYDIANCGPRHRFIANGRVVHNSDSLNLQNLPSGRVAGQSTAMRMAIEAPEDNVVLAADSSQIEVRVLAYEANQVDLLHNFANGVDPYSAMASRIYGVPAETILANHKAGNKEYTIMRQLGKAAVLGCGYGMGKARFFQSVKEGGLDIPQELADRAVDTYRTANASIVALWETCGDVLDRLIAGEEGYFGGPSGKLFKFGQRKLFKESIPGIMLPDGMWLLYRNLRIEYTEENGRSKKEYFFDRRKAGKPQAVRVYGPMLVENCIAEDTLVLTDRGWVKIQDITADDKVHDGVGFVSHKGLVNKGRHDCVVVDGVYMTPDHEVLTNDGWKEAHIYLSEQSTSQLKRFNWAEVWQVDRFTQAPYERKKVVLGGTVRMWRDCCTGGGELSRSHTKWTHANVQGLSSRQTVVAENSWAISTSYVCHLEKHEGSVYRQTASRIQKLRCSWNICMQGVVRVFRGVLQRYVGYLSAWVGSGSYRQQRWILQGELPLGDQGAELCQPKENGNYRSRWGCDYKYGVLQTVRNIVFDPILSTGARSHNAPAGDTSRCTKQVFDILNSGPLHRFVVLGAGGPFVVHNCTQALAFSLLKQQALLISKRYPVAFNVHDEFISVVPESEAEEAKAYMERCMRFTPQWLAGCPINCEAAYAKQYGAC